MLYVYDLRFSMWCNLHALVALRKPRREVPIVFALRLSQVQCLALDSDGMERLQAELGQQVIFTTEARV